MNQKIIKKCLQSLPKTSNLFLRLTGPDDWCTVLPFHKDRVFLDYAFMGFEIEAMGEAGYANEWNPSMFGEAINTLVAEHFGAGRAVRLKEWIKVTESALEAISEEGYQQHQCVNTDVFVQFINKTN